MKHVNEKTAIFSSYAPRKTEWDTARGIEAYRNIDGSVRIRISSETEWEDTEYKVKTITAEEAEMLGKALLCIPEDEDFGSIIERTMKRSE